MQDFYILLEYDFFLIGINFRHHFKKLEKRGHEPTKPQMIFFVLYMANEDLFCEIWLIYKLVKIWPAIHLHLSKIGFWCKAMELVCCNNYKWVWRGCNMKWIKTRPSKSKFFCADLIFKIKFCAETCTENAIKTYTFKKKLDGVGPVNNRPSTN